MYDNIIKNAVDEFNATDTDTDKVLSFYKIYGPLSNWNTSGVTDMEELFKDMVDFNENIVLWNTSNVTNMKNMFNECTDFTTPNFAVVEVNSPPTLSR